MCPARMCGSSRTIGAVYIECATSPYGSPIEAFIIDPPIHQIEGVPVMEALNLTPRGVQLREWNGVNHVFDFVGSDSYPDVVDFIEETRVLGASRRCELPQSEYAKLSKDSRIILIHPRAMILNHKDYYKNIPPRFGAHLPYLDCPISNWSAVSATKIAEPHKTWKPIPKSMCVGLWKFDLTQRDGDNAMGFYPDTGAIKRTLPCGRQFEGYANNYTVVEDKHAPAIFLTLPISRLALVDPKREYHKKVKKLEGAQIEWAVVDE